LILQRYAVAPRLLCTLLVRSASKQSGAALVLTMIVMTALLGLGALALLGVQSELKSTASSRSSQATLYTAESGVMSALDYLRNNCSSSNLFTAFVTPSNANPIQPVGVYGNNTLAGAAGNPFDPASEAWYSVTILNNPSDPGFAAGNDTDGIIIVHSVGHGHDGAVQTVEIQVQNNNCLSAFCATDFAQRGVDSTNDSNAACSKQVGATAVLRTITPGN
jgi:hypothetical protein